MTERTTSLALLYGATMTLPCPAWCAGHPYAQRPDHPVDVMHESTDTELLVPSSRGEHGILGFGLAQAPYSPQDPLPYGTVDLGGEGPVRLTPDEIRNLATALGEFTDLLRGFAGDLERVRAEAAQAMRPAGIPDSWPWPAPLDDEDGEL